MVKEVNSFKYACVLSSRQIKKICKESRCLGFGEVPSFSLKKEAAGLMVNVHLLENRLQTRDTLDNTDCLKVKLTGQIWLAVSHLPFLVVQIKLFRANLFSSIPAGIALTRFLSLPCYLLRALLANQASTLFRSCMQNNGA